MAVDPATIAMIVTTLGSLVENASGKNNAKQGSTYSKGARSVIDDVLNSIKGGIGGPNQDITQQQGFRQGNEFFNSLFNDQDFFNKFEAPAMRQFNEEIIPGLANRFAAMGSGGSTDSTAFTRQVAREGQNLETNLAAQRGQMQQNAVPQMLGYAQQPVSNWMQQLQNALIPTNNQYTPPSAGFFGGIMPGLVSGWAQGQGQQWGMNQANQNQGGGGFQPQGNMFRGYPGQHPSTY